jgi:nucleotide-binding universal stress UspA family protein
VRLVALGSSSAGLLGLVSLGGVAERILHSSDTPVALAPIGYSTSPGATVSRLTVAFGRADHDSELLTRSAATAKETGATMRVACFAVRPLTAAAGSIESSAEDLVVGSWAKDLESDIARALSGAGGRVATRVETVVGQGGSWAEALSDVSWVPGEVLVVGVSSSSVSRLFLGSHASKIVRNAGVPVLLLPRGLTLP